MFTDSSSDEDEVTSRPLAAVRQLRALTPPQRAAADRNALARQQLLVSCLARRHLVFSVVIH